MLFDLSLYVHNRDFPSDARPRPWQALEGECSASIGGADGSIGPDSITAITQDVIYKEALGGEVRILSPRRESSDTRAGPSAPAPEAPNGSPSWASPCSASSGAPRPCTRSSPSRMCPSSPSTATATASWRCCWSPSSWRSAPAGSLSTKNRCAAECAGSASNPSARASPRATARPPADDDAPEITRRASPRPTPALHRGASPLGVAGKLPEKVGTSLREAPFAQYENHTQSAWRRFGSVGGHLVENDPVAEDLPLDPSVESTGGAVPRGFVGACCEGWLSLPPLAKSHPRPVSSAPLIEPDVRFSRIRLSDRFHAGLSASEALKLQHPEVLMHLGVLEACRGCRQLVSPP